MIMTELVIKQQKIQRSILLYKGGVYSRRPKPHLHLIFCDPFPQSFSKQHQNTLLLQIHESTAAEACESYLHLIVWMIEHERFNREHPRDHCATG